MVDPERLVSVGFGALDRVASNYGQSSKYVSVRRAFNFGSVHTRDAGDFVGNASRRQDAGARIGCCRGHFAQTRLRETRPS